MKKWNRILLVVLVAAALAVLAGCAGQETPYEKNDAMNYTVSVKYDANGGVFTTNTMVIVDSYNLEQLPKGADGKAQIALITPEDPGRGNNAFTATRTGYFLAGWYAECVTADDGTQTYAQPWDFETGLVSVDPNGTYSSAEPVLTLYAAWIPLYEVQIYDMQDKLLGEYTINPMTDGDIKLPKLNEETGAVDMYKFPAVPGYTVNGVYADGVDGKTLLTEEMIAHPGSFDRATAKAENTVLKLYVDLMEGEWYHIYNVDQFIKNASVSGSYILHADLDFTDKIWPTTLMYGSFSGTIQGNGHKISHVNLEQTNNSKTNAGLFGALTESAKLSQVTFENIHFTIKSGTRVAGTSYGLLSGTVTDGASFEAVSVLASTLTVDANAYFGTEDYVIGKICGMGEAVLENADITFDNQHETAILPTEEAA